MKKFIVCFCVFVLAIPLFCGAEITSESDFSNFSNKKICYGMGVDLDKNNRPLGAIQMQQQYFKNGGVFIGDSDEKKICLTFDEGYENGYTPKILDILKEKNAKAIFFVTYDYCEKNPELIKRMISEGHIVGNHSWSHPSLPECSISEIQDEIMKLHDYVKKNYKYEMNVIRPPRGEFSEQSLEIAKSLGYDTMLWSFAYMDWEVENQPDPKSAYEKITSKTHNGAIYLLHAVSSTNTQILGDVIDFWKNNGYELVAE